MRRDWADVKVVARSREVSEPTEWAHGASTDPAGRMKAARMAVVGVGLGELGWMMLDGIGLDWGLGGTSL